MSHPSATGMPIRRLAMATSAEFAALNPDDHALRDLLRTRHAIDAVACVWNDPAVDWSAFDAVLVRSIWDYFQLYPQYLSWLDHLDAVGVRALNPTSVLRWNSDKRYLLELQQAGIAIAPTRLLRGAELVSVLRSSAAGAEVVVKPAVSGGAWHTVRGTPGNSAFDTALAALPTQLDYLLQPYLSAIAEAGEWSLLYFGGAFSHAVLKRPAAGDYRVQSQFGGSTERLDPPAELLAAASAALAASTALGHGPLSYARVDGVYTGQGFLLMEIELIEPYLFLQLQPGAAERLAAVIASG